LMQLETRGHAHITTIIEALRKEGIRVVDAG
jgi:hypothetical protein